MAYIRTCQSCGHRQETPQPSTSNDKWRDAKCRKCHSLDLDFGSEGWTKVDGRWTAPELGADEQAAE